MPKPTPAALAGSTFRPLTARPVAADLDAPRASVRPEQLPDNAPFRQRFEVAVRHSTLPKNARLLALTIATWADYPTGTIPAGRHPGVPAMARGTGLVEGAVREALQVLKNRGWIERVGDGPGAHRPSRITLLIPPAAP